jgi:hypothetical protein
MQIKDTLTNTVSDHLSRWCLYVLMLLSSLGWTGCATQTAGRFSPEAVAAMSPAADIVRPFDALRLAQDYVATHEGTEYLVGSGDSMMPLYRDHTVVVIQRTALSELKAGMTVVYMADSGRPVAHALVKRTSDGWVAMGVGNSACDVTRVTDSNLMGVVVRAFEASKSPMVALLDEAVVRNSSVASLP